jgi:molecular chaperone GrpE
MTKIKKDTSNQSAKNLTQLHEQINTLNDRLARSLADYSNLEKRVESQRQFFVTLATTAITTKMIEVLDELYIVYQHLSDPGLKIAIDKFVSILQSEGVEEIIAQDKEFDPATMDCQEIAKGKDNHVISVKKIGYKLNGHVIRPSQVVVGKSDPITN